jgi:hypothetical protein
VTPEENAAIVQGTIAYFGTYSVGVEDHLVTVHEPSRTRKGPIKSVCSPSSEMS